MSFAFVAQIILSGLAQGGLYALGALGLTIIYNATEVLNFAEGPLGALAAFATWGLMSSVHLSYSVSTLVAMALSFAIGIIAQVFVLDRIREATALMQTVATLGMFMLVEGVLGVIFGFSPVSIPSFDIFRSLLVDGLVLPPQDQTILLTLTITVLVLAFFVRYGKAGLAMRAIVQNDYAVQLMGVPVSRIKSVAWGIGCLLGALTAVLAAPITAITPGMMNSIVVYAFASAIIGGFGSLTGAVVGGLLLGVSNNLIEAFLAPQISMSFVFGIVALVLTIRPSGLFGRQLVQKV